MSQLTSEGALYELICRGQKDVYFQADVATAVSPFRNNYKRIPAIISERRQIPPTNNADFGKTLEYDFEVAGDVFTHPTLLITLPSWLPSEYASINSKSVVQDASGNTYGYTNGVGYFLFQKIQIYQDQILLQEFSGDALYASRLSRGSLNSAVLENELAGIHDGTPLSIGRNATPGTLRVELPLLGCQHNDDGGFPSFAIRSQIFRLRIVTRKLEDLIECSDGMSSAKPTPWDRTLQIQTARGGPFTSFQTLDRYKIDQPSIYLETRHIYVDPDTQKELVESDLEYPFSRLFENIYYFNERDYAPLANGAVAAVTRRIDAVFPSSRLFFFMRQKSDVDANRLWKITSDVANGEYYNNFSFLIASRDRETLFPPLVWNTIVQHSKEDRYSGAGLGVISWDLGEQRGRRPPFARQPEGSVNFSEADRPTLYVELQQIATTTYDRNTEMRLIVDTWSTFETSERRGGLRFAN